MPTAHKPKSGLALGNDIASPIASNASEKHFSQEKPIRNPTAFTANCWPMPRSPLLATFFLVFYLQKATPTFHPVFFDILTPKLVPKSLPKWTQNRHRIHYLFAFVFLPFFLQFLDVCFLMSGVLDPRFCCYLQRFRGVRHFSQSRKKYENRPPNNGQNNTKNAARSLQTCIQKRSLKRTAQKLTIWAPKMEPQTSKIVTKRPPEPPKVIPSPISK